jgi:cell division septum initiation protein DivIVA
MDAIDEDRKQAQQELALLRARVAELEDQLAHQAARTNQIVAATQERVYWLDRWHLDLNALMARPGAAEFRTVVRFVRRFMWRIKRLKRRVAG